MLIASCRVAESEFYGVIGSDLLVLSVGMGVITVVIRSFHVAGERLGRGCMLGQNAGRAKLGMGGSIGDGIGFVGDGREWNVGKVFLVMNGREGVYWDEWWHDSGKTSTQFVVNLVKVLQESWHW
ncbi:hypothetical protein Tco_1314438 [Tanacetum coccineum]